MLLLVNMSIFRQIVLQLFERVCLSIAWYYLQILKEESESESYSRLHRLSRKKSKCASI